MSILSTLAQSMQYDESMYDNSSLYNDSSYYSQQGVSTVDPGAAAAAGIMILVISIIIAVVAYVLNAFFLSRIFKKAGVEPWKAWVPFYNIWIMLELGDQKGYWAILSVIPFVNIVAVVFIFIAQYHIGLKLQKDGAFVLLAIFLPLVWVIWLAFDKSTWNGVAPAAAQATPAPAAPSAPAAPEEKPPTPPHTPPTA